MGRVLCTKLGFHDTDDVPVFTESDSSFCVDITSTKDGKFITVNSNSRTSSEEGTYIFNFCFPLLAYVIILIWWTYILSRLWQVYVIDAANPLDGLRRVCERVCGVQYFLEHHYGIFYILTNAPLSENMECSGGNYYLAKCRVEDIQPENWQVTFVLRPMYIF